ncbi:hypothetical protein GX48_07360 [Paracoccidioides brasiliensis]|nr:hypothetical protein GX48_07360 [Paracoccidioides brasiliensis]
MSPTETHGPAPSPVYLYAWLGIESRGECGPSRCLVRPFGRRRGASGKRAGGGLGYGGVGLGGGIEVEGAAGLGILDMDFISDLAS